MPIYEYQCPRCGEFEVTQRITDAPLKRCPTCKGKVKKLISNTSFQLKGSGWYQTDYGSKKSEVAKDTKDAPASSEGTTSSAGESGGAKSTGEDTSSGKKAKSASKKKDTTAKAA
jgi:putative FmdB family regulatory protein